MEPNHQLFGHFLRHHIEMLQPEAARHDEITLERKVTSGMRGAIGKLLKFLVNYYKAYYKGGTKGSSACFNDM